MLNSTNDEFAPLLEAMQEFHTVSSTVSAIADAVESTSVITRDQAKVLKMTVADLADSIAKLSGNLRKANSKLFALQPGER